MTPEKTSKSFAFVVEIVQSDDFCISTDKLLFMVEQFKHKSASHILSQRSLP